MLDEAATILFYCDGSDRNEKAHPLLYDNRIATIDRLMKRGVGFVAIHYAVFVPSKNGGEQYLDWMGGYFDYENGAAVNKWYSKIETKEYQVSLPVPEHPIVRGVQPFQIKEEYYFNMRSGKTIDGWPILTLVRQIRSELGVAGRRTNRWRSRFGYRSFQNWENDNVRRMISTPCSGLRKSTSEGRRDFLVGFREMIRLLSLWHGHSGVFACPPLDSFLGTYFRRPVGRTVGVPVASRSSPNHCLRVFPVSS